MVIFIFIMVNYQQGTAEENNEEKEGNHGMIVGVQALVLVHAHTQTHTDTYIHTHS